jgi:predicted Abi (CAAX) family protease
VALFVLWHPLNGLFLKTEARQVFLDPGFLTLAALLGTCSSATYLLTGSIWPSTLVHWVTVVVWKAFLGGRIFD